MKTDKKAQRVVIDQILNAPDLPSHVRAHRNLKASPERNGSTPTSGTSGKPRKKKTHAPLPPEWETAMEVGEENLYPDPPTGKTAPLDTSTVLDISTVFLDATPYSAEEPWGLMEGESAREYQFFSHYRAQGLGRVKNQVAKYFNISPSLIYPIAAKNDWDNRCRAWDVYREKIYTMELIEETRDMAKVHATIARKGVLALGSAFENLVERMEADPELWKAELADIPTKQLITLAQRSAQVIPNLMNAERLSRGMPTELISTHSTVDQRITVQTTDDLALILSGLFGALGGREDDAGTDRPLQIIDTVGDDVGSGEDSAY